MDNFTKLSLVMGMIIFTLLGFILGDIKGTKTALEEYEELCVQTSVDEEFVKIELLMDLFFDKATEFKNATGR